MAENDKTMAILSHVLGIFTGFIGPLIIYLVAKDNVSKDNAREALNWQISALIYSIISAILIIVLIGILMLVVVGILNLVFCILAAMKASDGELYKYPMTIRLVR